MVQFSLLATLSLVSGALAAPNEIFFSRDTRSETSNDIEARQGYYFQNWSEGGSNIRCNNGQGGSYTADWNSKGGFVCGKGWSGGGARTITFEGRYNATGPGYLAVYGWTRNPLIEYYIVESHAELAPNEPWTSKGNFTTDGSEYEIFTSTRVNKPSIIGTATFQQYWSVRKDQRTSGTVTTSAHVAEWGKYNMRMGNYDYVVLATEGYTANGGPGSSGSSAITVSTG